MQVAKESKQKDLTHPTTVSLESKGLNTEQGSVEMCALEEYTGVPTSKLPKPFPRMCKVEWQFELSEGVKNSVNHPHWAPFPKWENLQDLSNKLLDDKLIQSLSSLMGNLVLSRGKTEQEIVNVKQTTEESQLVGTMQ